MLITLLIILYILIGCVVGCAIHVYYKDEDEDSNVAGLFGGVWWPLTIVFLILCKIFTFLCGNICKAFEYLKNEGLHYYKEDIEPCYGQCKYIQYWNNHNEMNECSKRKGTSFSSNHIPCEHFRKNLFWRFKIRIGWDKKK